MTFEQLYQHHYHAVYTRLYSLTGRNHELAEDLTQETFLKAWRAFPSLTEGNVAAWLAQIARRTWIDDYRRRKAVPICSLEGNHIDSPVLTDEDARIDAQTRLATIPLILRLVGADYRYEEIAQIVGLNINTLKSHITRARRELREVAS
jgi:RNA polymerase sigma-70 factor, ECF subfamily